MRERFFCPLLFVLCLYVSVLNAQNSALQGFVYDTNDNHVLVGATVHIQHTNYWTFTDNDGYYVFPNLQVGNYIIEVSHLTYHAQSYTSNVTDSISKVNFYLEPLSNALGEVVVTGTGTMHHIQSVPVKTEVLGKSFLSMYNGQSVEEILSAVSPSFDFNQNVMGANLQMNALGNQYILILLNGERMHGDIGGQNLLGCINAADIQRIEIVKGAASSLYGSDAIAGVINIITKQSDAIFEITNSSRVASYCGVQQQNSVSLSNGKWRSETAFALKHSDGWQNTKDEWYRKHLFHNSVSKTVNAFTDYKFSELISYQFNKQLSADIEGSYYQKTISRPTGEPQYVTFNMADQSQAYTARLKYQLSKSTLFSFHTSYNQTNYFHDFTHITEEEHVLIDGSIIHPIYFPNDRFKVNIQERYLAHAKAVFEPFKKQRITIGFECQEDVLSSPYRLLSTKETDYTLAAYLQDECDITDNFNITGGVRLIKHERFGWHLTPKMSLLYKTAYINYRFTWSKGFKTPSIKELHYYYRRAMMSKLRLYKGNINLKPETSNYYALSLSYPGSAFTIDISAYYNELKSMISLMEVPTSYHDYVYGIESTMQYMNMEDAKIKGLEVMSKYVLSNKWRVGGAYSFTEAKGHLLNEDYQLEATCIDGVSRHKANMYVMWQKEFLNYHLGIAVYAKAQTKRCYREYGDADGYFNLKINSKHEFRNDERWFWQIDVGMDNILDYKEDKPYGYNYATKTPGRTFYISLLVKFKKK